jgi:hypothetical protein
MAVGTRIGEIARAGASLLPAPLLRAITWCYWRLLVAPTLPPTDPPARVVTRPFLLGAALFTLAMMVWRALRVYPSGVFDFYPLYNGGRAWRAVGDAYALDRIIPPGARDLQLFQIGNVYPFPAVLVTLPFSFPPPQVAAVLWVGCLSFGLVLALRLLGWSYLYLAYLPLMEGLRIEQYTIFVVILQLLAIWAWRVRRHWLLALCCALIIATKPNHALIFALLLTWQTRTWRHLLALVLPFLALSFLLQPNWVGQWMRLLEHSHAVLAQPFLWPLALFAIPLLLIGDLVGVAVTLQFAMLPFPGSYAASAVPLGVLGDRRSAWLIPVAILWMPAAPFIGATWATALTLLLPAVALSLWRWWSAPVARPEREASAARSGSAPVRGWLPARTADRASLH